MKRLSVIWKEHSATIILGLLIALGAFFRFYHLGTKSIYSDEALYWRWAQTLAQGGSVDPVIDLNWYFRALSVAVSFSDSEFFLRLPSALPGVLAIPLLYALLRQFVDKTGSLVGTALYALNPYLITVAHTVREHTLYLLFVFAVFYFYVRYIREKKLADLSLLLLFSIAGLFTHISVAWVLLALGSTYLIGLAIDKTTWDPVQFRGLAIFALAVCMAGIGFWIAGFHTRAGFSRTTYLEEGNYWSGALSALPDFVFGQAWTILDAASNELTAISLAIVISFGIYVGFYKKKAKDRSFFWFSLLPIPITIVAALLQIYPFFGKHRNNLYLLPGIFLLGAYGFSLLAKKSRFLFASTLVFMSIFILRDAWGKVNQPSLEELGPVTQYLCEGIQPEDQIFVASTSTYAFPYYWPRCQNPVKDQVFIDTLPFDNGHAAGALLKKGDHSVWLVASFLTPAELNRMLNTSSSSLGRDFKIELEENGAWLYKLAPAP